MLIFMLIYYYSLKKFYLSIINIDNNYNKYYNFISANFINIFKFIYIK